MTHQDVQRDAPAWPRPHCPSATPMVTSKVIALCRIARCGTRPAPYPAHPATTHVVGCALPTCHADDLANHRGHSCRDMRSCMSLTDITCAVDAARITSVAW